MADGTKDEGTKWADRLEAWDGLYKAEKKESWTKITEWYYNQFPEGLMRVNLIFSHGRSVVPQLYFKNPVASINIPRPDYSDAQLTLQRVDDKLLKLMKVKATIKKMIVSAFCFTRGWVKCGYTPDDATSNFGNMFGSIMPHYQRVDRYSPGRPWVSHVKTCDIAFDALVSDIDDSAWFAMRFDRSIQELIDDEGPLGAYMRREKKGFEDRDPDDMETFWEVWDKYTGRTHTQYDKDMIDNGIDIDVWPFYNLEFNWCPDKPFGISDAELIFDLQKEQNEIKTQIHEHRRTSLVKILARKNALDSEQKAKLKDDKVGPVVEVDGVPAESIMQFKPDIPMDLFTVANTNENDVRGVIGYSRNQLGETGPTKKTASEANIIQQQVMIRLDERRDMVADVIGEILYGVNCYVLDQWDANKAAEYGADPLAWTKAQEVKDTYLIDIVPDSTLPVSRQVKQQEAIQLYQVFAADPLIDPIKLRIKVLEAFETADASLLNQNAVAMLQIQQQLGAAGAGAPMRGPDQQQRQPRTDQNGMPQRAPA